MAQDILRAHDWHYWTENNSATTATRPSSHGRARACVHVSVFVCLRVCVHVNEFVCLRVCASVRACECGYKRLQLIARMSMDLENACASV